MSADTFRKLVSLASSPSTGEPEARAAWDKAFAIMRRMGDEERESTFGKSSGAMMPPPQYFQAFLKTRDGRKYINGVLTNLRVPATVRAVIGQVLQQFS